MDTTYSINEVAVKLNLSDKTLRRWEEAGKFSSSRTLGNQRRYTIEDLQILDAIKHGTIPNQNDLLTREQAALILGVSPVTIDRYVAEGKIHPFITASNTYFPRHILEQKQSTLKQSSEPCKNEPENKVRNFVPPTPLKSNAPLTQSPSTPLTSSFTIHNSRFILHPLFSNFIITLLLLTLYHFTFNSRSVPISPQPSGLVQGVSNISPQLLESITEIIDPSGSVTGTLLTAKIGLNAPTLSLIPTSIPLNPTSGTLYYDSSSHNLKIYIDNSWITLATTQDIQNLSFNLESNLATLSAQFNNQVLPTTSSVTR